jgi:hypothetical protein
MTTAIITAIVPMIGSACTPVSSTWREIDAGRRQDGCSRALNVQLAARPRKVMMSSTSCRASCAPLPRSTTIWRQRATDATFGSGFRSSPQMRSSSDWCSLRTPASFTPWCAGVAEE